MKKVISLLVTLLLVINLTGCMQNNSNPNEQALEGDWNSILEKARGTTVNFYGWGGSQKTNEWLDNYVSKRLKEEYDITFNRVPMNIEDILNKLLGEKQLGSKEGTIDIVWINGENFFTAKENGLLYGPFVDKLPNYNKYVDTESIEVKYDFGFPVEGYEAPYGKAQLVMIGDKAKIDKFPTNHEELFEMIKNNPGKFTYPAPPDFTGSAFVRNIIYDIVGYEQFMDMEADKEKVYKAIKPAIDYLKKIKPYLWHEGKTYPATIAQLDNMYADNEVIMTMSYNPNRAASKIGTGEFPKTSQTFIFEKGTIGNTHFLAIPYNATNKEGALVAINFILSPEAQASKYDPKNWGDLPVLDNSKMNDEEKKMFDDVKLGEGVLPQDVLFQHRLPEMPANLIPIIEEIWQENIPVEGE
ncbi:MAG: putative spermidine/putrescine transport system substrate-binding protein [Candidatus Petromonas sp.]|jgi:putative spermidine/putrescine transport system substrate-binding protein|nr:putative spermidine/putrescine transport system substrate-binding protein [Candidatus Petromonas sp.]